MGKQIKPQNPFSRALRSFTFPPCVGYTAVEKPPYKRQKPSNKGRKEVNHGMADDTSEALKIWEALRPMIDTEIAEKTRSCVRTRKMVCTTAPNGSVIGVAEPFGNEVKIPYSSSVSNAQVGDAVWVQWYYDNASTMLAISFGDGSSQEYLPLTGGTVTGQVKSTYNSGKGFYVEAPTGSAGLGFGVKDTTTNKSVYLQIATGGVNRGVYDASGSKWMMYCDSNDALRFSGVTDATKGDLGIDDLEDAIGSMETTTKTISSNNHVTFIFSGFCGVAILIEGANSTQKCILLAHCTAAGSVSVTKIGTASDITTSTDTNRLTVTNARTTAAAYARVIRITSSGTMPTA